MFITYDGDTGAAYISFIPEESGFVPRTGISLEEVQDLGDEAGDILLDIDEEGRLVGIEIRSPELLLRSDTLARLRD